MHDDRIVIVDEESPERRVEVVALEMAANIVDVKRSRAGWNQIGPRELVRRPGERPAGAEHNAVASVELA